MARRKTNFTLDEEYNMVVDQIASTEQTLDELKKKKKELEEKIKQEKLDEIYDLIQRKGLDIDNVKNIIMNMENQTDD